MLKHLAIRGFRQRRARMYQTEPFLNFVAENEKSFLDPKIVNYHSLRFV